MTVWIHRRADAEVAAERAAATGPLAGLRLAVKDNVDVAGLPTTAGCPAYAYLPDTDAPAVGGRGGGGAGGGGGGTPAPQGPRRGGRPPPPPPPPPYRSVSSAPGTSTAASRVRR
ncbi:amidase family protein [Nocardia farcinica]|uniref:amidase family protein n=1 Tax=Nocardia farcinica TaxID=37329 RepID=UPI003CC7F19B